MADFTNLEALFFFFVIYYYFFSWEILFFKKCNVLYNFFCCFVCTIFKKSLSTCSYSKILAVFPLLYNVSVSMSHTQYFTPPTLPLVYCP